MNEPIAKTQEELNTLHIDALFVVKIHAACSTGFDIYGPMTYAEAKKIEDNNPNAALQALYHPKNID